MKKLFVLFLTLISIEISLSVRHHNSKDDYTKITQKIEPDSELYNEQNCPIDRGTCSGENFCFCFDGYISTYEANTLCDYSQKDRTLYFVLEFVLSLGIGHFYSGKYIYASIKLGCFLLVACFYFLKLHNKKGIDNARKCLFIGLCLCIWQMIDGLCIFRGIYKDGNGKPTGFKYF